MAVNQIKAGALLSYIVIGASILLGILYTPFMVRTLGQAEFGLYSFAASIIAYLTILDLGFASAVVRYTAKYRAEGRLREQYEIFGMFLRLYIIIGIVALLIGLALAFNVEALFGGAMSGDEIDKMRIMLMLVAFNLAFTFPLSLFGSIITAYENFVFQKVVNLIRVVLNPLIMIVLLLYGYRAVAMVVATTLFNLVTLVINCYYSFAHLKIKILFTKIKWELLREVSLYSFWIFLSAIIDRIYWSSGQFILGIFSGTVAVAIYAVAIQIQQLYMMFSTAISGLFLPKVTAMVSKGDDHKALSDLFTRVGRLQYAILSFILVGFIILGRPFVVLWVGSDYADSYPIALLFLISLLVPLIQNMGLTILQARNQMRFRSVVYVAIAVVSLCLSALLARQWGAMGCAVATSGALIVGNGLIINIYYHRKVQIDIIGFWREIGRMSIIPALITIGGLLAMRGVVIDSIPTFVVAGVIYSAIYIPLFWRFSMNSYERGVISAPLSRILKGSAQ